LLLADEQEKVLNEKARMAILNRLREFCHALEKSQAVSGYWDRSWHTELAVSEKIEKEEVEWVRSTGHHLEWLALAPPDIRPSPAHLTKALSFTIRALKNVPRFQFSEAMVFNPYSHAGRAVLLWSGYRFGSELLLNRS
jgi:hypothetical protein